LYDLTGDLNIFLPSHENEYISGREGKMNLKDLLHSTIHVVLTGRLGVKCLDGERTTRDGEARSTSIELGKL
jgi:hypothetical protein